jgi:UDP-N-acetylglucosamine--N-acetylmuramyl-(pentapeptide) pyrophosphoryl-undecaprenol N-acetylglucosamine transferase
MMDKKLKVVMAGGGTGGHVFPAINIADAIAAKWESEIIFFGTRRGIESVKAPQAGYEIKFIPVAGFQRRVTLKNLTFPFKLLKSMNICKKELSAFQPDIVIGTGGYVMGPALKSAVKLGIPTVIQEQNSFPGVTTRLLAKRADMIFLAYNEAKEYLKGADNILVTGNPVYFKPVNEKKSDCRQMFKLNPELKTVLVFGGSQGAATINKAIKEIVIDGKIHPSFQLLWQTGQKDIPLFNCCGRQVKRSMKYIKSYWNKRMYKMWQRCLLSIKCQKHIRRRILQSAAPGL